MKKLRIKVFSIIFLLLTSFTLIIFITTTTRTYIERKDSITGILKSFSRPVDMSKERGKPDFVSERKEPDENERRIYLDFTIYTVILDNKGEYKGVINNTNNDSYNEKKIKKIANKIIVNHKNNFYVGNLYMNKYAYTFTYDNKLIIMDNTKINSDLINQLILNSLLFLICEIIIFVITYLITRWIIIPVKKSFEKQRVFVADASHELKTPLSVMIASADAYFNDKDDKWVYNMKNESERMTKLVTELLELAKTEKEQDIILEQNDLSSIIESSILTFEGLFYDNNIELKYNINHDIKLACNENSIIELMSILIDNAIRYCSPNGEVIVNLYKKNKQVILEVKNTGIPIKNGDEEKIFERFYKTDESRNRNKDNYGLGLAIAKKIVEQHNGNISAHSSDGYTTFKVIWNQK